MPAPSLLGLHPAGRQPLELCIHRSVEATLKLCGALSRHFLTPQVTMIGQLHMVNPTVSVRKFAHQQQKRSGGFLRFAQNSTAAEPAAQSPFWRPDVPGEEQAQAQRVTAQQPNAAARSYVPRPAGWSALEQVRTAAVQHRIDNDL